MAATTPAFWDTLDPYSQVRLRLVGQDEPSPSLERSAGPGISKGAAASALWHPDNPLFWFGLVGAFTAGAMLLSSGTVSAGARAKVGPVAGEVDVGKKED